MVKVNTEVGSESRGGGRAARAIPTLSVAFSPTRWGKSFFPWEEQVRTTCSSASVVLFISPMLRKGRLCIPVLWKLLITNLSYVIFYQLLVVLPLHHIRVIKINTSLTETNPDALGWATGLDVKFSRYALVKRTILRRWKISLDVSHCLNLNAMMSWCNISAILNNTFAA